MNLNLERVKRYFIVPILLTISLIMNPGVIEKQINNQKDHIILSYREKVWNIGIEAFRWFPVFGVGLDNWPLITPDRLQASLESKGKAYIPNEYYFTSHAHNIYLTYLTERGLIGFSALILLMTFWSSVIIKTLRADFYFRNSFAKTIQGASLAAFITVFFVGLFNTTLHHEHGLLSIFYFSLNIIYLRLHSKQKNQLKLFN
ncbi:MAG: O-antigen ligase domain-containing protein [Gammaproteobacteria bacterium]|nr:O-antigen ligase domain-containing protein [Gammaproteobacteria bacterium]